jgi:signal peptidase II
MVADRGGASRMIWLLPLCVVVLDQATKWLVASLMDLHQSIPLIGSWVCLTYILNPGGAFGVQWGHQGIYFVAAFVVIGWIGWHLYQHGRESHLSQWALALILGGALGNLIDRVVLGQVIDFIDVEFFDMSIPAFDLGFIQHPGYYMDRWPTFNIADSAVTVGVVTLLVTLWWDPILGRTRAITPPDSSESDTASLQVSE